ncbi:MAG: mannose-1-phosphate guanylyltransferase/mannose-6-phosphate isomerase [Gammaproteobacteria bacterium]
MSETAPPVAPRPDFLPVILCGGGGTRLWPLSRRGLAKPFLRLPGAARPLLAETYTRLSAASAPPAAALTVSAGEDLFLCQESAAANAPEMQHYFIGEPCARNTAAAVVAAAVFAARRFGEDAVLLALPADHAVQNPKAFWEAAGRAAKAAANGRFALLGAVAATPETGYGYIEYGAEEADETCAVRRFVEKPDLRRAEEFVAAGNFLWNVGVFCMTPKTLFAALPKIAPDLAAAAEALQKTLSKTPPKTAGGAGEIWRPAAEYGAFPNISFDCAVMEKTRAAAVIPLRGAEWSDVGTWRAVAAQLPADDSGNRVAARAELLDCRNCFVAGEGRLIAAIGAEDLHIVDSPDALLVARADGAERVREIFSRLKNAPQTDAFTARRPWGGYTVLSEAPGYKVKRIDINPGGLLSLQSHRRRSEQWTAVLGAVVASVEGREIELRAGESCHIPANAKHRLHNRAAAPAAIIEVQTGDYLGEDDIIRYEDIYGRADAV